MWQMMHALRRMGREMALRSAAVAGGSARLRSRDRSIEADQRGAVAFEFLLIAPFLLFLLFAIVVFGIALNQQLILSAAAQQGAQVLALGRITTTGYTDATSIIASSSVNLTAANVTKTLSVAGTTCSSNASCSALSAPGAIATVALTYPCSMTVMGIVLGSNPCVLYANSAATIQ